MARAERASRDEKRDRRRGEKEPEEAVAAPPEVTPSRWKRFGLAAGVLLLMMVTAAVGGYLGAVSVPEKRAAADDEVDSSVITVREVRHIRGLDLAREKPLPASGDLQSLIPISPGVYPSGRATEQYSWLSLEPENDLEISRPWVPRRFIDDAIERNAEIVTETLRREGNLGGHENLVRRPVQGRTPGSNETVAPEPQSPAVRPVDAAAIPAASSSTIPSPTVYTERESGRVAETSELIQATRSVSELAAPADHAPIEARSSPAPAGRGSSRQ